MKGIRTCNVHTQRGEIGGMIDTYGVERKVRYGCSYAEGTGGDEHMVIKHTHKATFCICCC